jgi:hypothetical protein
MVALLAGSTRRDSWAAFLWAFAFWDISYYAGLWATIRWPTSLLDLDVLFLIPVPWIAQVWFPRLVSLMTMLVIAWSCPGQRGHLAGEEAKDFKFRTQPVLSTMGLSIGTGFQELLALGFSWRRRSPCQRAPSPALQKRYSITPFGQGSFGREILADLFLGSDDASYVPGIELFLDGGLAQI